MAAWQETPEAVSAIIERAARAITGRQSYFLEVLGPANGRALSVVSFRAVERLGEPYRVTIELTHPDDLLRADYLGRDASFTIDAAGGTRPRTFAGCITKFSKLKTTADFSSYRIVVEAHIARLALTPTSRIYQHQSAPQIIKAILRRHGFKGHQFQFTLRRQYPQHKFRFQYQLSDWSYIDLLMRQEGIYSRFQQGKHGDIVVFCDDIDHYQYQPELNIPYRETAGLEAGIEAIFALQTHTETVPESFLVADYNPDAAWERIQAEANVARKDTTTYGQPYVYGTHHLDQGSAKWEAQLRHEAAIARQIVYEGESNVLELRPGRILHLDQELPDAPNGQVVIEVIHSGARDAAYCNAYQAIPSDRRFRLPLEEATWPRINGTLSARVTSPSQYKYAYLTQQGHYVVRFDVDFDEWNPGGESVPLRMAKPFAGKLQTGFHFPALDGDEALIEFRDGNPNKPYIAAFHHNSVATDLITNQDRWLSRNVIRTQSDNKLEMEDWAGEEHVKLSTEHSGKSQLALGHMVNGRREKRGVGFELRTSGWGALRAGKGLFISADDQPRANGGQLDMQDAEETLRQAVDLLRNLNTSADAAKAWLAEIDQQRELIEQRLSKLQKPAILANAPEGVGIASGQSLQLAARKQLFMTAGKGLDIGVLKRMTVAAGEAISLFAAQLGIRIFAAKGKVQVQAQGDALELMALKDTTMSSSEGQILITGSKGITLGDGSGAYIKIESGKIVLASPSGHIEVKGNLNVDGPAGGNFTFPNWASAPVKDVKGNLNFGFSE